MSAIRLEGYTQVREALRSRDMEQALYDAGGVVMADSLLVLHGDAHRRRRRTENRLFRRGAFRDWEPTVVAETVAATLAPCRAAGGAELLGLGFRTMTDLTARVCGIDTGPDDGDALCRFARTFSEGATLVHSTRDSDVVRAEVTAALEEFDARFLTPSIARRRQHSDDRPGDVLEALLRDRVELGLDDAAIGRECAFYLQAGSHPSANALAHAADDLFARPGYAPETVRRDPELVQRCVHESLRLHPASPVARRRARAEVRLTDGTVIPEGVEVELDLVAANRDPRVFDRPDAYDPYRELPPGVPRWGLAFGGGMHACVGSELAAGLPPGPADGRTLGAVTAMLTALLDAGARPDPADPPRRDPHSAREHFEHYPVLLDRVTPRR